MPGLATSSTSRPRLSCFETTTSGKFWQIVAKAVVLRPRSRPDTQTAAVALQVFGATQEGGEIPIYGQMMAAAATSVSTHWVAAAPVCLFCTAPPGGALHGPEERGEEQRQRDHDEQIAVLRLRATRGNVPRGTTLLDPSAVVDLVEKGADGPHPAECDERCRAEHPERAHHRAPDRPADRDPQHRTHRETDRAHDQPRDHAPACHEIQLILAGIHVRCGADGIVDDIDDDLFARAPLRISRHN